MSEDLGQEVTSTLYLSIRSWQVKFSFQNFQVLRGVLLFDPGKGRQLRPFQEGLSQLISQSTSAGRLPVLLCRARKKAEASSLKQSREGLTLPFDESQAGVEDESNW